MEKRMSMDSESFVDLESTNDLLKGNGEEECDAGMEMS
jgi:hypothetical protein